MSQQALPMRWRPQIVTPTNDRRNTLRSFQTAALRIAAAQAMRDVCDAPGKCIKEVSYKKLQVAKTDRGFVSDMAVFVDANPVEGRSILRFLFNVHRSHPDNEPMDIRKIMMAEQE